jgi:Family of unknown function (DUF5682)
MAPLAHIFGVRHFSPAAALHLRRLLDDIKPTVVLIEGPSDATDQLKHLAHVKTKPPVALLAFTKTRPVRSIVYPLASYSPEWVALRWALENKREVRFIDLPAAVFLEIHQVLPKTVGEDAQGEDDHKESNGKSGVAVAEQPKDHTEAYLDDPYTEIARIAGDADYETWWEREFEHTQEVEAYRQAIFAFGENLRTMRKDTPAREAETLLREAYMRREIRAATKEGKRSAVVVCGAYHAPVLTDDLPAMTDDELTKLPRADSVLTLMPYSYPRLSAQSGYGAGNHAPAYFQAFHEEAVAGNAHHTPARYLASLAQRLRRDGIVRSSAEVIEAVRLAVGLATMNQSPAPVLRDLRDAAITLLGQGDGFILQKALREVEIGTAVGSLPPGVSRTALQDDFHQLIKTLKLEKYIVDQAQKLELDLREDRTAKSKAGAFLDLARSTFLHRLVVLDIGFAERSNREQRGTAKEMWSLHWKPECEIRLAERSLQADSLESGAAFLLAEQLKESQDVGSATEVLLRAANCELADALQVALRRVQDLAVDEAGFPSAAKGIQDLADTIRYGNVRQVDPVPLRPVLAQLYLRATLLVFGATVCDDDAAKAIRIAMDRIQEVAFLGEDDLEPQLWIDAIGKVANSDSRNPLLSGYATALLIERGRIDDEALDREVARRLSPGTEASVGVNWFEGLVQRNRAALFMRQALWSCLARYVDDLDDDGFKRALLYLRRAFATFSAGEIRRVVGLLAEVWKGGGAELIREVERKLDETELKEVANDLEGLYLL